MTDNDRELLGWAARAAGYELDWFADGTCDLVTKRMEGRVIRSAWHPLTDDGDALRLAVSLRLEVSIADGDDCEEAWVGYWLEHDSRMKYAMETGMDLLAATRRAIVRAAAAIGESMK